MDMIAVVASDKTWHWSDQWLEQCRHMVVGRTYIKATCHRIFFQVTMGYDTWPFRSVDCCFCLQAITTPVTFDTGALIADL
jgi:hypothetical protein